MPNIIIIVSDDLGISDLGFTGNYVATPNIDQLAKNGTTSLKFYNFAKCTPSRAALLSGVYPRIAGFDSTPIKESDEITTGPSQGYFYENIVTLPEYLKSINYDTYMSGKWHLGAKPQFSPSKYGFDQHVALINGASIYFDKIILNDSSVKRIRLSKNDSLLKIDNQDFYLTKFFTDQAIEFLSNRDGVRPFFLYLPYTAPHWPIHAPDTSIQKFQGNFDLGWDDLRSRVSVFHTISEQFDRDSYTIFSDPIVPPWNSIINQSIWSRKMEAYAAQINFMDQSIGILIDFLKSMDYYDNTIIFFLSDNGAENENANNLNVLPNQNPGTRNSYEAYLRPWANVSNTPFRSYKSTLYEGGIRNILIAKWAENFPVPDLPTKPISIMDIYPTLKNILGASDESHSTWSGQSIFAKEDDKRYLCWSYESDLAINDGTYKLLYSPPFGWQLYDLDHDIGETQNIINTNKEIAKTLWYKLDEWLIINGLSALDPYISNEFLIYPNPTTDKFSIKSLGATNILEIKLYNSNLQLVNELVFHNLQLVNINVSQSSQGIYFIEIIDSNYHHEWHKVLIGF